MNKTNVNFQFDSEKIAAIKIYLEKQNLNLEGELIKSVERLYAKYIPTNVREYIEIRESENMPVSNSKKQI